MKKRDIETTPVNFLKNHTISKNLRAKMIDWMVEVLCSYKCKNQSFSSKVYKMICDKFRV